MWPDQEGVHFIVCLQQKGNTKGGPKKKQATAKRRMKPSTAKKKIQSILTAEIFLSVQGDNLEDPVKDEGNTIEYTMEEMETHDTKFNKQLLFWSDQKRRQSVSKV